jgi:Ca2+-binding RTX toxin-like protein
VVSEAAGEGTDTVQTTLASFTLGANVENLTFTGAGNFTGTGNDLANVITGGAGNDTLSGLAGNDTLNGGAGADTLDGGAGNDALNGGGGSDTATYATAIAAVTVNLATAVATGGAGNDTLSSVENLTGSAFDDTLTGNGAANVLDGGAGNDTLNGGAGSDTLNGGTGADTMAGGAGNDTYAVDNVGDVVTEGAGAGTDTVQTTLTSYALGGNVENLTFTGVGNFTGTGNTLANTITGGTGDDTLSGNAGNDTLIGLAGNDTLNGGTGNDSMAGGAGNDTYVVDSLADVVNEAGNAGTDTVLVTRASLTLSANVENLTFTGVGNFSGTGNALANVITGGAGNDTLNGAAGNDTLNGLAGNDTLNGDAGNDALNGGAGSDTLNGGAGSDTLNGGAGRDVMNGGVNNDVFVFGPGDLVDFPDTNSALVNLLAQGIVDRINGFDANPAGGQDLIDISGFGITAATFNADVSIVSVPTVPLLNPVADTLVRIDGLGEIWLDGVAAGTITAADFLLA